MPPSKSRADFVNVLYNRHNAVLSAKTQWIREDRTLSNKNSHSHNNTTPILPILGLAVLIVALCLIAGHLVSSDTTAIETPVVISEVMSKNTHTIEDDYGNASDWIELYNSGSVSVDLSGWMLMGGRDTSAYVFSDETLEPHETLLIYASGRSQNKPGYVRHAPFKLSSSGDSLTLIDPNGNAAYTLDIPALNADVSWALTESGEYQECLEPTPGTYGANVQSDTDSFPRESLCLSELMADNATYTFSDGCTCDYIELYNASGSDLSLDGYTLSDSELKPDKYALDGLTIPAYGYIVIHLDGVGKTSGHASFGLSDGEGAYLYNPNGTLIDCINYDTLEADQALSYVNGSWTTNCPPTPGLSNTRESAASLSAALDSRNTTGLVINEVCFSNTTAVDGRNTYDWIEIRNTSSNTISLEGWGLSDDPGKPRKWQFPAGASIKAGDYMVIMASGNTMSDKDRNGYYQVPFKLSGGESVTLCMPDGTVVDRLPAMQQYGDISCGRIDGQSGYFYFTASTVGEYNGDSGLRERCTKPVFTVSGGLYDAGETVTIEITADPDALIFYTLDSTTPTTSSAVYSGPFTVAANTVVRAIATRRGSIDSYVATETYLFGLSHNLRVVSLVTDPDNLYDSDTGIMTNPLKSWERAANVEVYDTDGTVIQASHGCGLALNGDASRKLDNKSFRVVGRTCYDEDNTFSGDLISSRDYDSYRSFLLRGGGQDSTRALIRDPFIDSLAADTEVMYQAAEMCVMYVNGEFYGVYDICERISTYSICDFEGWEQTKNIDLVKKNDLVQNGSNSDYVDLLEWIKDNPDATDENIAYIETRIDMDNYIDYMVFMVYSANQDVGTRRYRSTDHDGKWRWIVYDQDFGFYNDTNSISRWLDKEGAGAYKTVENKLFRYIMSNDKIVDRYLTRFGELLAGAWAPDALLERFDALVESIRPEMEQHCAKWSNVLTYSKWESQIELMRSRIQERSGKIIGYLSEYFELTEEEKQQYFGEALKKAY